MPRPALSAARRAALCSLAAALLASSASAQIVAVHLAGEKPLKKHRKHLVELMGEQVIVGEPVEELPLYGERSGDQFVDGSFSLYVIDPGDPLSVPYRLVRGKRRIAKRRQEIKMTGHQVRFITFLDRQQSLYGLAREYEARLERIEALEELRDGQPAGSWDRRRTNLRWIAAREQLSSWLAAFGFQDPGDEIALEARSDPDAEFERLDRAVASVRLVPTPTELVEASLSISGGEDEFKVQESEHLRVVYLSKFPDARIEALLQHAERAIDGFRRELVDPYLGPRYRDHVPNHVFSEFWFGPQDKEKHRRYLIEYYGLEWGSDKERYLGFWGSFFTRREEPKNLIYYGTYEGMRIEGKLAHRLGHDLARLHYGRNLFVDGEEMPQDWLQEAVGYYLSLEFFGGNNITCFGSPPEGTFVAKPEEVEEEGTPIGDLRSYLHTLAGEEGRRLDALALRTLYELDHVDLATSWSVFEFLVRTEGLQGQLLLRAAGSFSRAKIARWHDEAERIYGVGDGELFTLLDARWREYLASR